MLIPLKTDEITRRLPIITILLMAVNMVAFAYQLVSGTGLKASELLFSVAVEAQGDLNNRAISEGLRQEFKDNKISLADNTTVSVAETGAVWLITDADKTYIVKKQEARLDIYVSDIVVQRYGAIPYELAHLVDEPPFFPRSHYLSLLTYMFLHGGFVHILGNMLFLNTFGPNVEDIMGRFRFLIFYILCGVVSALVYVLPHFGSKAPLVGASGAIAGVMGAHIRALPRTRIVCLLFFIIRITLPAIVILLPWIFLQFYNIARADQSNVAFLAHIGGFFLGVFLVRKFESKRLRKREYRVYLE